LLFNAIHNLILMSAIVFVKLTVFLTCYIPKNGLLFFPEVKTDFDLKKFYALLYKKYHMVVTEGRFFQMPRHFRIASIWKPEVMEDGLRRLEAAMKDTLS
jgi:aspartate/methionine/tyrosine aminotransferase